MVVLSNQYQDIKVPISTRFTISEMKHTPKDAPKMVSFLVETLLNENEIKNKSFKELHEDGSRRIEFIQSICYLKKLYFFKEFCAKRC